MSHVTSTNDGVTRESKCLSCGVTPPAPSPSADEHHGWARQHAASEGHDVRVTTTGVRTYSPAEVQA